jgi:hypothetical protein
MPLRNPFRKRSVSSVNRQLNRLSSRSLPALRNRSLNNLGYEPLETRWLMAVNVLADYVVTQNWGSGFEGKIQLKNQQATAISDWKLEFDFGANITSIWDGKILSHSGTRYVIGNAGWNSTLAAGGQISFGFVASPGSGPASPINYMLNGQLLGGTTPLPTPALPSITIADVSISEGNSGVKNATFTIDLSSASTTNVSVQYATRNGTATAGSDYTAKSGSITFSPGQTRKTVAISVTGDTNYESDEDFLLELSSAVGATLSRSKASGKITNDDAQPTPPPPPTDGVPANISYNVTNDWGNGFTADITIRNTGSTTLRNWTLQFNFAGQISSIWNASIVSRSGNQYIIEGASWNREIAAGQSITVGFTGSPGGGAVSPINFVLLGQLDSGGTTGGNNGGNTGGGTNTGTPATSLPTSQVVWPQNYYAPYVDSTLWPLYDFVSVARNQNVKFFTLAFITADPSNKPAWGGFSAYAVGNSEFDTNMKANIAALRALGGDVMVSFGGAANREIAEVITNVDALAAAYQSVIDAYGLTHIDFDIEGAATADRASVDRRSQAISKLQQTAAANGRTLEVWFTLPVLPTGLTADGLYVVQSALKYGVNVAGVNIMTMDYGDSAAPNPSGKMGDYAIQAATSLFNQLKAAYNNTLTDAQLWDKVGVTPMIGLNDVTTEVFDQQEAREVLAWAQQVGITRISMWSLNRDYQHVTGTINHVDNFSSSLLQSPLEFSLLFNEFTA